MQENEIKQLLTMLKLNYPATYRDMSIAERKALVQMWRNAFGSLDVRIVGQALQNYIKVNKYPPTIAGLQEQIDLIMSDGDTGQELWNVLKKAIANGAYHAAKEFEKLPTTCKKYIGAPSGLRDLAMVDTETLNTVTKGQFLKSIGEIKERERVQNELPDSVKQALTGALQIGE